MPNPTLKLIPIASNTKPRAVTASNVRVDTTTIHRSDCALKWTEAVEPGMKQTATALLVTQATYVELQIEYASRSKRLLQTRATHMTLQL